MFLENYFLCLHSIHSGDSVAMRKCNDTTYTITTNNAFNAIRLKNSLSSVSGDYNAACVVFGNGDTPPALGDYRLSGEIIRTISGSGMATVTNVDGVATYESLLTVVNTGEESVTIKEVGLTVMGIASVLIERTLLEEPITIPAGGVGQITYTIRMVYPTE